MTAHLSRQAERAQAARYYLESNLCSQSNGDEPSQLPVWVVLLGDCFLLICVWLLSQGHAGDLLSQAGHHYYTQGLDDLNEIKKEFEMAEDPFLNLSQRIRNLPGGVSPFLFMMYRYAHALAKGTSLQILHFRLSCILWLLGTSIEFLSAKGINCCMSLRCRTVRIFWISNLNLKFETTNAPTKSLFCIGLVFIFCLWNRGVLFSGSWVLCSPC